jgi:hypothetical protein
MVFGGHVQVEGSAVQVVSTVSRNVSMVKVPIGNPFGIGIEPAELELELELLGDALELVESGDEVDDGIVELFRGKSTEMSKYM